MLRVEPVFDPLCLTLFWIKLDECLFTDIQALPTEIGYFGTFDSKYDASFEFWVFCKLAPDGYVDAVVCFVSHSDSHPVFPFSRGLQLDLRQFLTLGDDRHEIDHQQLESFVSDFSETREVVATASFDQRFFGAFFDFLYLGVCVEIEAKLVWYRGEFPVCQFDITSAHGICQSFLNIGCPFLGTFVEHGSLNLSFLLVDQI